MLLEDKGLLLVLGDKGQVALLRASSQKADELGKFRRSLARHETIQCL